MNADDGQVQIKHGGWIYTLASFPGSPPTRRHAKGYQALPLLDCFLLSCGGRAWERGYIHTLWKAAIPSWFQWTYKFDYSRVWSVTVVHVPSLPTQAAQGSWDNVFSGKNTEQTPDRVTILNVVSVCVLLQALVKLHFWIITQTTKVCTACVLLHWKYS